MHQGRYRKMNALRKTQAGITLIEMILVIVILAIVGGMVGIFLSRPVQQYRDLTVRTQLSDSADTAIRRISRELHLAVPNSIRMRSSDKQCVEFIPSYDGGRYRAAADSSGAGNVFLPDQTINSFDVIGNLNTLPTSGDFAVIYNLGIPGADAYANTPAENRFAVTTPLSLSQLNFAGAKFPFASPGNRFQLVSNAEKAVSYVCTGAGTAAGNGTGTLYRVSNYGFDSPEPGTCANVSSGVILAQNISSCQFAYTTGVLERVGLVSIKLSLLKSGESISLYHDVNVNNVP